MAIEQQILVVTFAEYLPLDSVSGMVTGIAAYGNVIQGQDDHTFIVSVFRMSKLDALKKRLGKWEQYGFLRWSEVT